MVALAAAVQGKSYQERLLPGTDKAIPLEGQDPGDPVGYRVQPLSLKHKL
jgi:hypothetical protein